MAQWHPSPCSCTVLSSFPELLGHGLQLEIEVFLGSPSMSCSTGPLQSLNVFPHSLSYRAGRGTEQSESSTGFLEARLCNQNFTQIFHLVFSRAVSKYKKLWGEAMSWKNTVFNRLFDTLRMQKWTKFHKEAQWVKPKQEGLWKAAGHWVLPTAIPQNRESCKFQGVLYVWTSCALPQHIFHAASGSQVHFKIQVLFYPKSSCCLLLICMFKTPPRTISLI